MGKCQKLLGRDGFNTARCRKIAAPLENRPISRGTAVALKPGMAATACIAVWTAEPHHRECLVFESESGCDVRMTLEGMPVLEQHCASVGDALTIAERWREHFPQQSVFGPRAA